MSKEKKDKQKETPEANPETAKTETLDELEALKIELESAKDKYFRALAEMDNFKKRATEEGKRDRKYASQDVCDKLIDPIDILDAALKMQTEDANLRNFLYGFKMIRDMLFKVIEDEGVKQIALKLGDKFDPSTQQAIESHHSLSVPDQAVVKIVKFGYSYKDRLLRPAMVEINIHPEPEPTEEQISKESDQLVA
jgi:molecular chaperone GrpE